MARARGVARDRVHHHQQRRAHRYLLKHFTVAHLFRVIQENIRMIVFTSCPSAAHRDRPRRGGGSRGAVRRGGRAPRAARHAARLPHAALGARRRRYVPRPVTLLAPADCNNYTMYYVCRYSAGPGAGAAQQVQPVARRIRHAARALRRVPRKPQRQYVAARRTRTAPIRCDDIIISF